MPWFVFGLGLLIIVVPAASGALYSPSMGWAGLLIEVIVVVSAVRLAGIFATGRDRIVSLVFWLYVYVFLGLAPIAQLVGEPLPLYGALEGNPNVERAALLVLVGLLAYELGGRLGRRRGSTRVEPLRESQVIGPNRRRVLCLAIVALPLSSFLVLRTGGLGGLLSSREELEQRLSQDLAILGLQVVALTVPVFVAAVFMLGERHVIMRSGRRLYPLGLVCIVSAATLATSNPLSQPRFWSGTVLFAIAAVLLNLRRPASVRVLLVGSVVIMTFVFPSMALARYEDQDVAVRFRGNALATTIDYDSFHQIANGIGFVDRHGLTLGRQATSTALFWVPRDVWGGKGEATGPMIASDLGLEHTIVSSPLWIEFYVDFSWIGTFLVFAFYGWASSVLERAWLQRTARGNGPLLALMVPAIAAYQVILLRGALLPAFGRFAVIVMIAAFCYGHPRRRPLHQTLTLQARVAS